MVPTATLLLEIGTEELPSSFVDAALSALPGLFTAKLLELRLAHGAPRALGTPRRLSVLVPELALRQSDVDEEVVGPPEGAAFRDGVPTRAAEAFAARLGIAVSELRVEAKAALGNQRAGRYVVGRRTEAGRGASELLGAALVELCAKIPFRKSMRWGSGEVSFGRPVQWLVALLGDEVIPMQFAGIESGRTTRGHRFLAPRPFELAGAEGYVEALLSRHVMVDRQEREAVMMDRVREAAKIAGGAHDPDPTLVAENVSLVEEPQVITGRFEERFLALPPAVIRSVARGHQKYFCVEVGADALVPKYLAVVNTALSPDTIARGMDRVMRARLSDATFFFDEDRRARQEDRVEKLSGIVFHNRLGTVREKVTRMTALTGHITALLGIEDDAVAAHVDRATYLCKSDLVSLMVGEFPELQGHMGRSYALHAGEHPQVADAIRDHYLPLGGATSVPTDDVAIIVALADRLDTLVGCFAVGLAPTGTADPFGLRRACIALLRILVENARDHAAYAGLSFAALVSLAYSGFSGKKLDLSLEETQTKVLNFATERLRSLVAAGSSNSVADAVLGEGAVRHPAHVFVRARVLHEAVSKQAPWLDKAKTVAKRLLGIARDARPVFHAPSTFRKPDDAAICDVVARIDRATQNLTTEGAVREGLATAEDLAQRLEDVFVNTLVIDPDDDLTPKRLEVLSHGARAMLKVADFSRLG